MDAGATLLALVRKTAAAIWSREANSLFPAVETELYDLLKDACDALVDQGYDLADTVSSTFAHEPAMAAQLCENMVGAAVCGGRWVELFGEALAVTAKQHSLDDLLFGVDLTEFYERLAWEVFNRTQRQAAYNPDSHLYRWFAVIQRLAPSRVHDAPDQSRNRERQLRYEHVISALQRLYPGHDLMEFGSKPTYMWMPERSQCDLADLKYVLASLSSDPEPPLRGYSDTYDPSQELAYLRMHWPSSTPNHFNGKLYAMRELEIDEKGPRLHCRPGRFFDAHVTSWALQNELLDIVSAKGEEEVRLDDLPLRKWLVEQFNGQFDHVVNGNHRCAEVAVSTLTLWHRPTGWTMVVSPRSNKVATEPFQYHVAPSGKLAPLGPRIGSEDPWFSVYWTVVRELLEEVFSIAALESDEEGFAVPEALGKYAEFEALKGLLSTGRAALLYTGLVMNMMNLQPEICTVLIIDDPNYLERMNLSWEYARDTDSLPKGQSQARLMTLEADLSFSEETLALLDHPERLVPHAAAAIELGLPAARSFLGIAES